MLHTACPWTGVSNHPFDPKTHINRLTKKRKGYLAEMQKYVSA
jgi:hypothetical protein